MKNYKDLLNELPSKTVVFTCGKFNPPNVGHELAVKVVRKLAKQRKADHFIFVSSVQDAKKNPLEINKKIQYLELLFPNTKFIQKELPDIGSFLKKYKNVIMVTTPDMVNDYKKLLKKYNFDSVDVVSAGSKDPDSDDKLIKLAGKGNYLSFKNGLPTTIRDLDGKRLMNDIRIGLELEPIKEQINLVKDDLREQYFRGEIFNEGDIVESNDTVYRIVKRGSNHLLLQNEEGLKVSKWIQDVQLTERQFMLDEKLLKEDDQTAAGTKSISHANTKTAERQTKMAELKAKQASELERVKEKQAQELETTKSHLSVESVESPVVNKNSKYNIAKSLMSLHDFRKTMNMGIKGVDQKAMDDKETESDMDASTHATSAPQHTITGGQHMDAGRDESLRRMRVKYHLGEETEEQQDTRKLQLKRFKDQAAGAKLCCCDGIKEDTYAGLEKEDKPGKKKTEFKGTRNSVSGDTVEGWKDEDIGFKHTKTTAVKEEAELEEAIRIKDPIRKKVGDFNYGKKDGSFQGEMERKQLAAAAKDRRKVTAGSGVSGFNSKMTAKPSTTETGRVRAVKEEVLDELSKTTLKSYIKANKADTVQRASSDSFKSGKAGDAYNKADETHKDKKREQGLDRALDKLSEDFSDINEEELITLVEADLDALSEDAFYEAYDDEELAIIDDETGEEIEAVAEEAHFDSEMIMEVLSRIERIRAKARLRRSAAKRQRREKVALRQLSTPEVANRRARRMAVSALKKRLLRGQNPQKVSVGQKERIERFIQQRRKIVDRLATRMVSRVKQVEKARMAHKKFTKPNNGVSF